MTVLWVLPIPAVAAEALEHLPMEETVVVESLLSDPQATVVGTKTIEKGRNINLPYHSVLSLALRYIGDQETFFTYTAGGNQRFSLQKLGSFITADAELKIPVTKYGEMSLYAENIPDKQYQERFGFPLTGRIIGGAMKITF